MLTMFSKALEKKLYAGSPIFRVVLASTAAAALFDIVGKKLAK